MRYTVPDSWIYAGNVLPCGRCYESDRGCWCDRRVPLDQYGRLATAIDPLRVAQLHDPDFGSLARAIDSLRSVGAPETQVSEI